MKTTEWLSNLNGKVEKDVETYVGTKPNLPDASAVVALAGKLEATEAKYDKATSGYLDDAKKGAALYDKALAETKKAMAQMKDEAFGLNVKDKADLKKITEARALYMAELTDMKGQLEKRVESIKSFTKGQPAGPTAAAPAVPLA